MDPMIQIEKSKLNKFYKTADNSGKMLLSLLFGKEVFQHDFKDIKTFEDACRVTGRDPLEVIRYQNPVNADQENSNAFEMMKVIRKAIVGNWEADWNNSNQKKWFPYFKMGSGFGFSYSCYVYDGTFTYAGSRLCYETEEQSDYTAKQFIEIYKKLQN